MFSPLLLILSRHPGLSYRDVEELLVERGITVDHVTVYRSQVRPGLLERRGESGGWVAASVGGGFQATAYASSTWATVISLAAGVRVAHAEAVAGGEVSSDLVVTTVGTSNWSSNLRAGQGRSVLTCRWAVVDKNLLDLSLPDITAND